MHVVKEFIDIKDLNDFLSDFSPDNKINKIFRSPDKVYFVWYERYDN